MGNIAIIWEDFLNANTWTYLPEVMNQLVGCEHEYFAKHQGLGTCEEGGKRYMA